MKNPILNGKKKNEQEKKILNNNKLVTLKAISLVNNKLKIKCYGTIT